MMELTPIFGKFENTQSIGWPFILRGLDFQQVGPIVDSHSFNLGFL